MQRILYIILFFLASCGYQPLYSSKDLKDFTFKEVEFKGDKNLNRKIFSALSFKKDTNNFSYENLILENKRSIIETSKNSKGQPDSFKMVVEVGVIIKDNKKLIKEKSFYEEFSYNNLDNKFDLSEYEINLENNLINKIVEKMILHLNL